MNKSYTNMREPDFTQPLWLRLEKSWGDLLLLKRMNTFFVGAGCLRSGIFNAVANATSTQEAEQILAGGKHFVVYQPPSLLKQLVQGIKQWLK
jgi:hypothetical protein